MICQGEKITHVLFAYQGIPVGRHLFDWSGKWEKFWFVRIEIRDVYKGTKYDDTCIAGVKSGEKTW